MSVEKDEPTNSPCQGRRVTLKDIAAALGVSHVTVSMALRNSPRVAKSTTARVKAKAEEMGYSPDPMLTALAHYRRSSKTRPIDTCLAWLNLWPEPEKLRSYKQFDRYWQGAQKAAEAFGFRLEEFALRDISANKLVSVLKARNIPGLLIPPANFPPAFDLNAIPWDHFAVVQLGLNPNLPAFHSVTSDQMSNAQLAFDRMLEKGYRRIGFCGCQVRSRIFGAGFYWAQCGLPETDRIPLLNLPAGNYDLQFEKLKTWVDQEKPDAIFIDELDRYDIPRMLLDMGCRVPEDLGLAATNVLDTAINAGIDQNPEEIGKTAMHTLIAKTNNRRKGAPDVFQHTLVQGRWADGGMLPDRT